MAPPMQKVWQIKSMADIREVFPTPDDVSGLNFMLFSTSGVHGHYLTIEEVESELAGNVDPDDGPYTPTLTVMILQPRVVRFGYGNIEVEASDIEYLKALRQKSWDAVAEIGA